MPLAFPIGQGSVRQKQVTRHHGRTDHGEGWKRFTPVWGGAAFEATRNMARTSAHGPLSARAAFGIGRHQAMSASVLSWQSSSVTAAVRAASHGEGELEPLGAGWRSGFAEVVAVVTRRGV
jgi:urease accessory protein UreF